MSAFVLIRTEQASFPVSVLCRVLRVSRAGYYAWAGRRPSPRSLEDEGLTEAIREVHSRSRKTYGAPRTQAALAAGGRKVGRKRVARLMRRAGLHGKSRRRGRPRTTVVDPRASAAPNLVQRQFRRLLTNRLWVGDITYLRTTQGWLYLAVLLDACSRRVVGWAIADHMRTDLVLEALRMAVGQRWPIGGELIHHTDRGSQYTSHAYQAALASLGITCSMSRAGDCYDNALAEAFFSSLKAELADGQVWATQDAARQAVFEWIAVFYNRQRRHSALGFRTPEEFEAHLGRQMQAA